MNDEAWLNQLSQLTQLPYFANHKVFGDTSGTLIGTREGYLVVFGLGKTPNGQSAVKLLLRYAKADSSQVKDGLKETKGKFGAFTVEETTATGMRVYSFGKPDPQEFADTLTAMVSALKPLAQPLAGRCEPCQRSESQITLSNGIPGYFCASCQQQVSQELDAAGIAYDQLETNLPQGALYGIGAALVGGVAWGLVAYAIKTIFLWGAILIGGLVGKAVVKGMGKVTWAGRILIGVLTIASVVFGDILFYTLMVMSEMKVPFSQELVMDVLSNLWALETSAEGGLASVAFALIGAGYVVYSTRRPEFKARFEPL